MKKIICAGLALLMCGGLVFSVTACSGDDDDDNGNSGVVNNDLGLRVIAVGDYKYSYYDDGKLEAIYYNDRSNSLTNLTRSRFQKKRMKTAMVPIRLMSAIPRRDI